MNPDILLIKDDLLEQKDVIIEPDILSFSSKIY